MKQRTKLILFLIVLAFFLIILFCCGHARAAISLAGLNVSVPDGWRAGETKSINVQTLNIDGKPFDGSVPVINVLNAGNYTNGTLFRDDVGSYTQSFSFPEAGTFILNVTASEQGKVVAKSFSVEILGSTFGDLNNSTFSGIKRGAQKLYALAMDNIVISLMAAAVFIGLLFLLQTFVR